MTYELPEWLTWLHWVVGADWPDGDEDGLRRMSKAWKHLGKVCDTAVSNGDRTVGRILTGLDTQDGKAFEDTWASFTSGDSPYLVEISSSCDQIATLCDGTAEEIEYLKYVFTVMLIILAIEVLTMIALAAETFGASLAEAGVEELITQGIARLLGRTGVTVIERYLTFVTRHEVAYGLIKGIAPDVIAQTAMIDQGDEKGGWNFARTGQAVEGTVVNTAMGKAAKPFTAMPWAGGDTLRGEVIRGATTGAVGGAVGAAAIPLLPGGDPKDLADWHTYAQGATSGAVGGATGALQGRTATYHWEHPESVVHPEWSPSGDGVPAEPGEGFDPSKLTTGTELAAVDAPSRATTDTSTADGVSGDRSTAPGRSGHTEPTPVVYRSPGVPARMPRADGRARTTTRESSSDHAVPRDHDGAADIPGPIRRAVPSVEENLARSLQFDVVGPDAPGRYTVTWHTADGRLVTDGDLRGSEEEKQKPIETGEHEREREKPSPRSGAAAGTAGRRTGQVSGS